jgi:hypothetical protein
MAPTQTNSHANEDNAYRKAPKVCLMKKILNLGVLVDGQFMDLRSSVIQS